MISDPKQIYIIVSQTGTILSRFLKVVTGAEYNHVSISLRQDLRRMYSFGRKNPYNPFWAGFVVESTRHGTFKRFPKTKAVVLALDVPPDKYEAISLMLSDMLAERNIYHYNYLGLCLSAFRIRSHWEHHFYCSEFVREVLLRNQVASDECFPSIVMPIHFLELPKARRIYAGTLKDYSC